MPKEIGEPVNRWECEKHMEEVRNMHKELLVLTKNIITNLKGSDDGTVPGLRQEFALMKRDQEIMKVDIKTIQVDQDVQFKNIHELQQEQQVTDKVNMKMTLRKATMWGGFIAGSGGFGALVWYFISFLSQRLL